MKKIATTTILAALLYSSSFAQLNPTKLSVFSNGTFFEQKEGSLKFKDNKATVDVPATVLKGTYWLATEKVKIKQVDVKIDTVKKEKQSQFIDDFLEGNEGKNVTLRFKQYTALGGNFPLRSISGLLVSFYKTTGLIKLRTIDGKMQLIYITDLSDADFEANASDTFQDDTLIRRATILLDKSVADAPLTQVTMQTGLQWQPSYYIKLEGDKEAKIIMKATVENGTQTDYYNVDLDLVVGAPQLYFGSQTDALSDYFIPPAGTPAYASYQWDFGDNAEGQYNGTFRRRYRTIDNVTFMDGDGKAGYGGGVGAGSYTVTGQDAAGAEYYNDEAAPMYTTNRGVVNTLSTTPGVAITGSMYEQEQIPIDITANKDYSAEGKKSADLYYYHAGKATLPKNAKTLVPISQSTVPYKHVYEATIGDITNYELNRTVLNPEPTKIEVYHSLKLTNKTGAPLTDAPVFVVNENEAPMAQDMMPYTPVNEEVSIKLAKAIDVSVKSKEEENSRVEKAKKFNKKSYDKVTLKGTIEVCNFLDKPITLNVKKALRGEVTNADGGSVTKPGRFTAINPVSLIKWDVELKPGEKKTITYEYDVYVSPM